MIALKNVSNLREELESVIKWLKHSNTILGPEKKSINLIGNIDGLCSVNCKLLTIFAKLSILDVFGDPTPRYFGKELKLDQLLPKMSSKSPTGFKVTSNNS